MTDATVKFLFKAFGAEQASKEIALIGAAAQQAGLSVKKYLNTAAGSQQMLATQTRAATAMAQQQTAATEKQTRAVQRGSKAQESYFGHIAKTTVQSALINKLFLEFVDVSGQAIQQVDSMQNFPATMASMGQSTADANLAFQKLSQYVGQVGGNLGDATSYVTRFTGATKDVKSAVAIFTGLNNALIAGDSSIEEQRQSMVQFAQALERGRPDMKEWRNLTQNMSFQLAQVAKEMGYVNADALGTALTTGKESMAEFTTELTKLSTGTGPIAQQAMARMNGVQFSFNVLKNTMVQGLAAIINAFGRANIVSFFQFLTQVVKVLTGWVVKLVQAFVWLLNIIGGLFGLPPLKLQKDIEGVASGIGSAGSNADDLAGGLQDAGKEAKKLNKSLASFDQMNVLPDKESGGGGSGDAAGAGGPGFDAGQIGELGDLFGDISGNLEEASKWAKIFAGIVAGIAAIKFAGPILDQIKKVTDGFKGGAKAVNSLRDAIKESSTGKEALNSGKTIGQDLKTGIGTTFSGIPGFIGGMLGGLAATVGPAISGALAAGAAALGVSVGVFVLIIVAAIAVIAAVIYTIYDNWDAIVNAMKVVWEKFTGALSDLWKPAVEELNKQWDKFYEIIRPGVEKIQELFNKLKEKLAPIFQKIKDAVQPLIDKIKELYKDYIQPLIDKFKEWAAESGTLLAVLKVIGIIITVAVLTPLALLVAAIAAVVAIAVALAAAFIWILAKVIEFGAYILGGGLWEDIQAAVEATGQWIKDRFNEAVEWVKGIFSTVADWFKVNVWDRIMLVFSVVGTWFKDRFNEAIEGIKSIWNFVVDYFKNVWEGIKLIFSVVVDFYKGVFSTAWSIIQGIWNAVVGWFTNVWNGIKNVFNVVGDFFRGIFQGAWDNITRIFSGLWNWFKTNVWDRIVGIFGSIGSSIGDAVSGAFKGVVNTAIGFVSNMINTVIRAINGAIGIINKIPGVSIGKIGEVSLPRLARGGIVDQPTTAIIGEEGREAIVPLENNTEWIDKLAAKINTGSGNGKQPIQLTVQIGEEQIARKVIDLINEKTNMSGRNVIYV